MENSITMISDVTEFCLIAGHDVAYLPHIPPKDKRDRRISLCKEEWRELHGWLTHPLMDVWDDSSPPASCFPGTTSEEWKVEALAGIADGIADLIYVLIGTALQYGLPLAEVWERVQAANMAKFPGGVVLRRHDGKILKPPGWQEPDIKEAIRNAITVAQQQQ